MKDQILLAMEVAADRVIELQDRHANYIMAGYRVPESLQDELDEACQALDDLQEELDQCEC